MPEQLIELLTQLGLKPHMVWQDGGPPIYDEERFIHYVEPAYRNSKLADMDEHYRISEHIMLDRVSGVRVKDMVTESYAGDRFDYRTSTVFVLYDDGKKEEVIAIDLVAGIVHVQSGAIPLERVNRTIEVAG